MAHEIWADIYDAAGNRQGAGPLTNIYAAGVSRMLDGAGTFTLTTSAADKDALEMLTNERRIRVFVERDGAPRLFAHGIIRNRDIERGASGLALNVSGVGILDELKRRNTLLGRSYSEQTLQQVGDDLISLHSGWTVNIDSAIANNMLDLRLDGVSVLKGFQKLFERYAYHIRLNPTTTRQLDVSRFGADSGYRAHNLETMYLEAQLNPDIVVVENIGENLDSETIFNRLYVIGAGEGTAALTLADSTRTAPYTIQQTPNEDGTAAYYIEDTASITEYGLIEKFVTFKEINTLSNSEADLRNASNALYDAAVVYLARHKEPYEAYRLSLRNVDTDLLVGDKIHLDYIAEVDTDDGNVKYLELRGDYWIMESTENVTASGMSAEVVVTNVDRHPDTVAKEVMAVIEAVQARDLKPSVSGSVRSYVYDRQIDPHSPAKIPIEFTAATRELQRVRMRIRTRPLRVLSGSTAANAAQSSSAGGDHRHRMFEFVRTEQVGAGAGALIQAAANVGGGGNVSFLARGLTSSADLFTRGASGDHRHTIPGHSHEIDFGLFDDTQTPTGLTVLLNGRNRTQILFEQVSIGNVEGAFIDATCDAGELVNLLYQEPGGLRQLHEIEIRCADGQGEVEVILEAYEQTQTIALPLDTANVILFLPTDVPATPTALALTAGDARATASWNTVVLATHYDLRWRVRDSGNAWTQEDNFTVTEYEITMLENDSEYEVQVRAGNVNADPPPGDSAWSASQYVTPVAATVAPPVPTAFGVTAIPNGFSWRVDAVATAASYVVRYREDGETMYETMVFGLNEGEVTGLTIGQLYNVGVAARNSAGDSAYTTDMDVTPVATPPPGLAMDVTLDLAADSATEFEYDPSASNGSIVAGSANISDGSYSSVLQHYGYSTTNEWSRFGHESDTGWYTGFSAALGTTHTLYVYHERRSTLYALRLSTGGPDSLGQRMRINQALAGTWEDGDDVRLIIANNGENAAVLQYIMDT